MHYKLVVIVILAASIFLISPDCNCLAADADSLPPRIRESLEKPSKMISPISVSWTQQFKKIGQSDGNVQALVNSELMRPEQFFSSTKHTIKFQDGMLYDHREIPVSDGPHLIGETAVSGAVQYFGQHNHENKSLRKQFISKLVEKEPDARSADTSYFENAAFYAPSTARQFVDLKLDSLILHLLDNSAELIEARADQIDNRSVFVIEILADNPAKILAEKLELSAVKKDLAASKETPEAQEKILKTIEEQRKLPAKLRMVFSLDPDKNYAVQKWEHWYAAETLLRRGTCSDFVEIDNRGIWLPKNVSVAYFDFLSRPGRSSEMPVLQQNFIVTQIATERIPNEQFMLNYTDPGTVIWDGTTPEAVQSPAGLVASIVGSSPANSNHPVQEKRATNFRFWFIGANLIAVIVLAGAILFRKKALSR